jgi:hypothetical protein
MESRPKMVMMIIIIGYEYKRRTADCPEGGTSGRVKEEGAEGEQD